MCGTHKTHESHHSCGLYMHGSFRKMELSNYTRIIGFADEAVIAYSAEYVKVLGIINNCLARIKTAKMTATDRREILAQKLR